MVDICPPSIGSPFADELCSHTALDNLDHLITVIHIHLFAAEGESQKNNQSDKKQDDFEEEHATIKMSSPLNIGKFGLEQNP